MEFPWKLRRIFLKAGRKVIDLSADFRIRDAASYEAWYGRHTAAGTIPEAVYGLPELLSGPDPRRAGWSPIPAVIPRASSWGWPPSCRSRWVDTDSVIADSKSGVSGAGRDPQIASLFCEVDGGFKAYKVGGHRHTPEIEQELSLLAGSEMKISFTPHLLPVKRGILSTIYAKLQRGCDRGGGDGPVPGVLPG